MESSEIDALDRAIIDELREDGRASWRELGERVGLGPTATADRVRRLERLGVIRGYGAEVDMSALGIGIQAIAELRLETGVPYSEFEATLGEVPEVTQAFHVTGSMDYVLLLACADVDALNRVLTEWRTDGGAIESETRLLLREIPLRRSQG